MSYNRELRKYSTNFVTNARVLHHTYDRGSLLFKNVFVYLGY